MKIWMRSNLLLLIVVLCLSGCDEYLKRASSVSSDGQKVAQQYSRYMNLAAAAREEMCKLSGLKLLVSIRATNNANSLPSWQRANDACIESQQKLIADYKAMAVAGDALAAAYKTLGSITGNDQVESVGASMEQIRKSLENASDIAKTNEVKQSLGFAATAITQQMQARGVKDFAKNAAAFPASLAESLSVAGLQLDLVFSDYEEEKKRLAKTLVELDILSVDVVLKKYMESLGYPVNSSVNSDKFLRAYAVAFLISSADEAEKNSKDSRAGLIMALNKLASDTNKLSEGVKPTADGTLEALKKGIDYLEGILAKEKRDAVEAA